MCEGLNYLDARQEIFTCFVHMATAQKNVGYH